jgi:hypothetical protein
MTVLQGLRPGSGEVKPPRVAESVVAAPISPFAIASSPEYAAAVISRAPWWMLPTLGTFIILLFAATLFGAFWVKNEALILVLASAIMTSLGTVLGFFFGSSASSQKKDDTNALATAALAVSTPPGEKSDATVATNNPPTQ